MGNTVGSANTDFCNLKVDIDTAYIIGLWCADGYLRTSSVGISNTDTALINKFKEFFLNLFPKKRLKVDVYYPDQFKRRTTAYHLYVNSRSLARRFKEFKKDASKFIEDELIIPYFAGRFDGDGSVAADFYKDCRIVYGNLEETENDFEMIKFLGFKNSKIYHYQTVKTFCLYVSRMETAKFLSLIYPYSVKLQKSVFVPRRDLILQIGFSN